MGLRERERKRERVNKRSNGSNIELQNLSNYTLSREQNWGKHHCTSDLFILFKFSCFAHVELASALLVG